MKKQPQAMPAIAKTSFDIIYERRRREREERTYATRTWVFAQGHPKGVSGAHVRVERLEGRDRVKTLCGHNMRQVSDNPMGANPCPRCLELSKAAE